MIYVLLSFWEFSVTWFTFFKVTVQKCRKVHRFIELCYNSAICSSKHFWGLDNWNLFTLILIYWNKGIILGRKCIYIKIKWKHTIINSCICGYLAKTSIQTNSKIPISWLHCHKIMSWKKQLSLARLWTELFFPN